MKKILLVIIGVIILVAGVFVLLRVKAGKSDEKGVLKVAANPVSTIFLDNQSIGKTPYEDKVKPGEYTLKLVPETTVGQVTPWEGRVTVRSNLLTFVNRELKDSEVTSAGEILMLEKISGSAAELTVISTPDAATVSVDGKERGKTPLSISDLKTGSYEVAVSAVGFAPRSVKLKTTGGFKLTAIFNLAATSAPAPSPEASSTPSPSEGKTSPKPSSKASPQPSAKTSPATSAKPSGNAHVTPPAKPYVQILETPTGFLRVRGEAGSSGEEVGRVNPGEFYALLDETDVSNTPWYKIEYETGKEGFVSSQYAKKFE